jgi:hypothetical protein
MTSLREPQGDSKPRATHRARASRNRWQWLASCWQLLKGRWQLLNRRQQWLAACAVAALVTSVAVYIAISNNGSLISGSASISLGSAKPIIKQFTPAHRSSSSDTPEAAVAAMRLSPTLAAVLREWNAGRGGATLTEVSLDTNNAIQAAGEKLFVQMRPACSSLAGAVTRAKATPPIPDASLQALYVKALGTLTSAAAVCLNGIDEHAYGDDGVQTHESPTLVSQSVTGLTAGAKDLYPITLKITVAKHR